jgi:hypothetical protein
MARLLLVHLWLAVVASPLAPLADEVKLGDDITASIQTSTEFDVRPFGYRVTWINWDSYFRESELRLGDRILGVNGERYTRETHNLGYAIGNHGENRYWAERGAKDGDPVTLIVERDGEETTVSGRLMANRFYFNDDGRQTRPDRPDQARRRQEGPRGLRRQCGGRPRTRARALQGGGGGVR